MGFRPWKLLFFQPVLLQARERGQPRVRRVSLTAALLVVEVSTAIWAQSPAVTLANDLQGQRQQHLFSEHVRQKEAVTLKKADLGVIVLEPVFFRLSALGQRSVKQIKRAVHVLNDRFQAACADHFNLCFELTLNADLTLKQLRGSGDFHWGNLLDLRRMEIDAAREIALPDAQLSDREFFDIEEQV